MGNRKTFKRLPNGFGSITKLSGNRRKPWNARTPKLGENENYSPIAISLGCFETWGEAYECLQAWHKKNDDPSKWVGRITFAECFDRAFAEKIAADNLIRETRNSYTAPFKNLAPLHSRPLDALRIDDLQKAVDGIHLGYTSKAGAIRVIRLVYNYAMKHDYIDKDYSLYVKTHSQKPEPKEDKFFTWEERFEANNGGAEYCDDYVQKKETIYGHFLICYLALFLLRVMEIKCFKNRINAYDLIEFIRDFRVARLDERTYVNLSRNQKVNEKIKGVTGISNLDALYLTPDEIDHYFGRTMLI